MKKSVMIVCCVCAALMMQSCYSSTVCVGNMTPDEPAVCVNTIHNHHFIDGLVGNKEIDGKKFVSGKEDYKFKHYRSFVDGVLTYITGGIYTPTTTKIYLPVEERK